MGLVSGVSDFKKLRLSLQSRVLPQEITVFPHAAFFKKDLMYTPAVLFINCKWDVFGGYMSVS